MPVWSVQLEPKAIKDLRGLDGVERKRVLRYLHDRVQNLEHPRQLGAPLAGEKSGLWRCRVGNIRIVAQIDDGRLVILVIAIAHRSKVYR